MTNISNWVLCLGTFLTASFIVSGIVMIARIKPRDPEDKGRDEQ